MRDSTRVRKAAWPWCASTMGGQVHHSNAHLCPLSHPHCLLCTHLLPFLTLPIMVLLLLVALPSFFIHPDKHHLPAQNHSCTLQAGFLASTREHLPHFYFPGSHLRSLLPTPTEGCSPIALWSRFP